MIVYQTDKLFFPVQLRFFYQTRHLYGLRFITEKREDLSTFFGLKCERPTKNLPSWLIDLQHQMVQYFTGCLRSFSVPSSFLCQNEKKVFAWQTLGSIPYGQTISYKKFAEIAQLSGPRHAGLVLSQNPFPLICPCHRVIRSDGTLGGFTPELEIKKKLLTMEKEFGKTQTHD